MVDAAGKLWVTRLRPGPVRGRRRADDDRRPARDAAVHEPGAGAGQARAGRPPGGRVRPGATLYELLTGRPAVDGEDRQEILRRIAFEEPIAPRKVDKAIPAELETVTLKCLAKNPTERYAAAGDLADDLRRWLGDQPIQAKPPTLRQRATKWVRRNPGRVVAAVTVLIVVAIAAMASTALVYREQQRSQRAYAEAGQALDELFSDVVDDWLSNKAELTAYQRSFLERAQGHYQRFAAAMGDSENSRVAAANAQWRVACIQNHLRQWATAAEAFSRHDAQCERLVADFPDKPEYRFHLARSYDALGRMYMKLGRMPDAQPSILKALAVSEGLTADFRTEARYRELLDDIQHDLAVNLACLGRTAESEGTIRRLVARGEQLVKEAPEVVENRVSLARSYTNLGYYLNNYNLREEAERAYRQSLAVWGDLPMAIRAQPVNQRGQVWTCLNYGRLLWHLERFAEAEPYYGQTVALMEKELANPSAEASRFALDSPRLDLALIVSDQGKILEMLGRRQEAEQCFRRSVALLKELAVKATAVSKYQSSLATQAHHLGVFLKESGRLEEAIPFLRQAAEYSERVKSGSTVTPNNQYSLAVAHLKLAEALDFLGRSDEAEPSFRKVLDLAEQLAAANPRSQGLLARHARPL